MESIMALYPENESEIDQHQNGWAWLRMREIPYNSQILNMRFAFFENKLRKILFTIHDLGTSREEQSGAYKNEEWHRLRYRIYDQWFKENAGEKVNYSWGTASAYYSDQHEYDSGILIKYGVW